MICRTSSISSLLISDPSGVLEWKAADRVMMKFIRHAKSDCSPDFYAYWNKIKYQFQHFLLVQFMIDTLDGVY
jgi:hypothetical protein